MVILSRYGTKLFLMPIEMGFLQNVFLLDSGRNFIFSTNDRSARPTYDQFNNTPALCTTFQLSKISETGIKAVDISTCVGFNPSNAKATFVQYTIMQRFLKSN